MQQQPQQPSLAEGGGRPGVTSDPVASREEAYNQQNSMSGLCPEVARVYNSIVTKYVYDYRFYLYLWPERSEKPADSVVEKEMVLQYVGSKAFRMPTTNTQGQDVPMVDNQSWYCFLTRDSLLEPQSLTFDRQLSCAYDIRAVPKWITAESLRDRHDAGITLLHSLDTKLPRLQWDNVFGGPENGFKFPFLYHRKANAPVKVPAYLAWEPSKEREGALEWFAFGINTNPLRSFLCDTEGLLCHSVACQSDEFFPVSVSVLSVDLQLKVIKRRYEIEHKFLY